MICCLVSICASLFVASTSVFRSIYLFPRSAHLPTVFSLSPDGGSTHDCPCNSQHPRALLAMALLSTPNSYISTPKKYYQAFFGETYLFKLTSFFSGEIFHFAHTFEDVHSLGVEWALRELFLPCLLLLSQALGGL